MIGTMLLLMLVVPGLPAARGRKPTRAANQQIAASAAKSKTALINLSKQYKATLENVLKFRESEVKRLAELEDKRQQLYLLGAISKQDLEKSEQSLLDEKLRLASVRRQIEDADTMISEAEAIDDLLKPAPFGKLSVSGSLVRYHGSLDQGIAVIAGIKSFFNTKFGRPLPISALGQSATHDRLGFDHRHAVDVALDPSSREGQALMDYLRGAGISFIAFHHAMHGVATGAHIHIGRPSSRL